MQSPIMLCFVGAILGGCLIDCGDTINLEKVSPEQKICGNGIRTRLWRYNRLQHFSRFETVQEQIRSGVWPDLHIEGPGARNSNLDGFKEPLN